VTGSDFDLFHRRLRRAFAPSGEAFLSFDEGRQIGWGYDTQKAGSPYSWDGMRRGISARQPRVLFQYTLSGRGGYAEGGKTWSLGPEQGFTVLLPSSHRYFLPADSSHWTFFWFMLRHPLVEERIGKLRRKEAAAQNWPHESAALQAAAALFEAACAGQLRDIWSFEERVFAWLWETERELYRRRYPADEREQLLEKTRRFVLRRLERSPSGADLAEAHGLERTRFCRKFKMTTGQSPAAFVTAVRLEEALKLLRTGPKLEEIAARTGFADANHFCKVFRRHFHSSPGAYRKLVLKK